MASLSIFSQTNDHKPSNANDISTFLKTCIANKLINSNKKPVKMVNLGDTFPDFSANTTIGHINFHEWLGDSLVLKYSYLQCIYFTQLLQSTN